LNKYREYRRHQEEFTELEFGTATAKLIKILKPLIRLEQLTLMGEWKYSPNNIVELVSSHNQTLQVFALKRNPRREDFLAAGNHWDVVLSRLIELRPCALKLVDLDVKSREMVSEKVTERTASFETKTRFDDDAWTYAPLAE
jgi:hypothetical protein